MARRSRNNRRGRERDTLDIALEGPLDLDRSPSRFQVTSGGITRGPVDLIEVEDRRNWHPDGDAPLRSPRRWRHRLVLPPEYGRSPPSGPARKASRPKLFKPAVLSFQAPRSLALCVRRKRRRAVIFAAGKQGGRHRKPRRNKWSSIQC